MLRSVDRRAWTRQTEQALLREVKQGPLWQSTGSRARDQGACVMDGKRQELLEIYKLHAVLADRVSRRHERANWLYLALLFGLTLLAAVIPRFGADVISMDAVLVLKESIDQNRTPPDTYGVVVETALFWIGVLGVAFAISWYIVIRSCRRLNTAKFHALMDLEHQLEYPFFTKEWELLGAGKKSATYWCLAVVETVLPGIFLLLFGGLAIAAAVAP